MGNFKDWYADIKAVRDLLKTNAEWNALNPTSQHDYEKKFAKLGDRLPADTAQCKKSYYTLRAAYLHCQARAIRKNLNLLDKWLVAQGGLSGLKERPSDYFVKVKALGLEKQFSAYRAVTNAKTFDGSNKGVLQPTHSKRAVGRLPLGWKTKLLGSVPRTSKYKLHIAAMSMCGCRPSEFENGVLVTKINEDTYKFEIEGKKTGERTKNGKTFTTGQSIRTITISRTDYLDKHGYAIPDFFVLDRAMKGQTSVELMAKATAIRDVVINASNKAFPDLANKPTAYSFRHAFASDLKGMNGIDSEETAAALGHASTKTQGCYGYGKSGGGGFACKSEAADRIRTPHLSREASLKKSVAKNQKVAVKATNSLSDVIDRVSKIEPKPIQLRIPPVPTKPVPSYARPPKFR